jgi:hypothetical protein
MPEQEAVIRSALAPHFGLAFWQRGEKLALAPVWVALQGLRPRKETGATTAPVLTVVATALWDAVGTVTFGGSPAPAERGGLRKAGPEKSEHGRARARSESFRSQQGNERPAS